MGDLLEIRAVQSSETIDFGKICCLLTYEKTMMGHCIHGYMSYICFQGGLTLMIFFDIA